MRAWGEGEWERAGSENGNHLGASLDQLEAWNTRGFGEFMGVTLVQNPTRGGYRN